jgi:DNA-binding response OmpR family regulator
VLLDIEMPNMDGFEACQRLRKVDPELPIIFVTAHADVDYRHEARKSGGDSFLTKPIQKTALLSLVNLFLSNSARRKR